MTIPGFRPVVGEQMLQIDGTGLPSGVYLLRLTSPVGEASQRIHMIK